jgi:hypothetical protein
VIYFCGQRNRRTLVLAHPPLNGIDYLEVADGTGSQTTLLVTFLRNISIASLAGTQFVISGGESVTGIQVVSLGTVNPDAPKTLPLVVSKAGDFSTYTLSLQADANTTEPPAGFDPILSSVVFSFKAGCPVTQDCAPVQCCPTVPADQPAIDYLAKDYLGFVQVMFDRMSVLMPSWTERHPSDVGVALVESLAYVADHLSYRQDAIATEAYLGTARSRISLRRHAKLVDYTVFDGCNARVWIHLDVTADGVALPAGSLILPKLAGAQVRLEPNTTATTNMIAQAPTAFATLSDATLNAELNQIAFYTWGDTQCCLGPGATEATLAGHFTQLSAGDVMIFEEVLGPDTGQPEDANPAHRCAVLLTSVKCLDRFGNVLADPITGQAVTEITWNAGDALPFSLCVSSITDAGHGGLPLRGVSVARGNIVAADHGMWLTPEDLGTVPSAPVAASENGGGDCCGGSVPAYTRPPFFFPGLASAPLTFKRDFDSTAAASLLTVNASTDVLAPQIVVTDDSGTTWTPEPDLLDLGPLQSGFVIEIERDGTAYLRFGDGQSGAAPGSGTSFTAQYRTGNGAAGNVGADTLGHVVTTETRITGVRNPLPAGGGVDPDSMETIRQRAPWEFRTQLRAVTEDDYGDVAARNPAIREARGTLRWTGSWRTAFVTIDPAADAPSDIATTTLNTLGLMRMAGVDLDVEPAIIVGLRVTMNVCVLPGYFRTEVRQALMDVLTSGTRCDGTPGLLNPINFTFGQTIYLSPLIAAAQNVDGVGSVTVTAFARVDDPAEDASTTGAITLHRLEIARIDNDPSRPDHGIFELDLDGGQ